MADSSSRGEHTRGHGVSLGGSCRGGGGGDTPLGDCVPRPMWRDDATLLISGQQMLSYTSPPNDCAW